MKVLKTVRNWRICVQLNTLSLLIAVLALIFAGFRESNLVGLVATLILGPATGLMLWDVGRRGSNGTRINTKEQLKSWMLCLGVWLSLCCLVIGYPIVLLNVYILSMDLVVATVGRHRSPLLDLAALTALAPVLVLGIFLAFLFTGWGKQILFRAFRLNDLPPVTLAPACNSATSAASSVALKETTVESRQILGSEIDATGSG